MFLLSCQKEKYQSWRPKSLLFSTYERFWLSLLTLLMVLAFLLTWKPKTLSSKKTIWSRLFYSLRQQYQWNVTFQVLTIHWKAPLMWQQWMRSLVMLGLWGSAIIIVWWTVNKVSQHRRDCLIIHLEEIERVRENVLERNALNKQHCLKKKKVTWHKTKYGDPILGICALHLTHPKHAHTHVKTNIPWTHTQSSGQPFMLQHPGRSWGFGALLKGTSVMVLMVERVLDIHPSPTYSSCPPPPTVPALPHLQFLPARDSNLQHFDCKSNSNH